jgi:FlaA1/EpsC-like NDP-sugar epimerase
MSEFIRRRRQGERLIVYGAGDGGAIAIRELQHDEHRHYQVLGFIDDDPRKVRLRVLGHPVLGGFETLEVLARQQAVDAVVVTARSIDPARLHAIEELCAANGVVLSRLHFRFEQLVAS